MGLLVTRWRSQPLPPARQAMMALSSLEFEGVLHPVFEEDEVKLIVVGGTLGALVGVFQLFVLNG